MDVREEADASEFSGLRELSLDELAADEEAARIVARLARMDAREPEPVPVAAFNSFI